MQPQMPAQRADTICGAPDQVEIRRAMSYAETHAAKTESMQSLELAVADAVINTADDPDVAVIAQCRKAVGHEPEVRTIDLRMHNHEAREAERALDRTQIVERGAHKRRVLGVGARRIFYRIAEDVRLAVAAVARRQRIGRTDLPHPLREARLSGRTHPRLSSTPACCPRSPPA